MRNQDEQLHLKNAVVKYYDSHVSITVYLSLKKSVFKAMDSHWSQIMMNTLSSEGAFSLRQSFRKGVANQITLHRELRWDRLTQSPAHESASMYHLLKNIVSNCQIIYRDEIMNYLYNQYINDILP